MFYLFRFLHWFLNIVIDLGMYSFFLLPLVSFRTNAYLKTVVDQTISCKITPGYGLRWLPFVCCAFIDLERPLIKQICHNPYLHFELTKWEIVLLLLFVVSHFIVAPEPCFSLSKMIFYPLTAKGLKNLERTFGST